MSKGKVEISKNIDSVFGNVVKLSNGFVELAASLDFGPRILYFSKIGMENMLYQDKEKKPLGEAFDVFGGVNMKAYGGHRLWISPEVMPSCYYPDDFAVECIELKNGNGVELIAPVEKFNNIQKSITIELATDSPNVFLKHKIKNCGAFDIEVAPWSITMHDVGGLEIMPQPSSKTGYLHNRNFSLWDYSAMNDPRVYFGKDYITLKQDAAIENPFKLGYNNEDGWAAYFNKGQVFIKFFEPEANGFYPDGGCCYETYTCGTFLELETLGQLSIIAPNESVKHIEEWEIYEESAPANDEGEIKKVMDKYIQ